MHFFLIILILVEYLDGFCFWVILWIWIPFFFFFFLNMWFYSKDMLLVLILALELWASSVSVVALLGVNDVLSSDVYPFIV